MSFPDLPTDYDRVVAAIFELESGQHAAWYALRANDSRAEVVQAMEDSAKTVTARKSPGTTRPRGYPVPVAAIDPSTDG